MPNAAANIIFTTITKPYICLIPTRSQTKLNTDIDPMSISLQHKEANFLFVFMYSSQSRKLSIQRKLFNVDGCDLMRLHLSMYMLSVFVYNIRPNTAGRYAAELCKSAKKQPNHRRKRTSHSTGNPVCRKR